MLFPARAVAKSSEYQSNIVKVSSNSPEAVLGKKALEGCSSWHIYAYTSWLR